MNIELDKSMYSYHLIWLWLTSAEYRKAYQSIQKKQLNELQKTSADCQKGAVSPCYSYCLKGYRHRIGPLETFSDYLHFPAGATV